MKLLFAFLFTILYSNFSNAQISIYMRLIDYSNNNIYSSGTPFEANPNLIPTKITHEDEALITTFADGEEQTLNIGSQSTGAGAGKVYFDTVYLTKTPDSQSPAFFKMLASGTPFKFMEISFYKAGGNGESLFYKVRYALAAFKSIQRAAATCSGDCPNLIENLILQAGAKYITIVTQGPDGKFKATGGGWNRVRNASWDGMTTVE